MGETGHVELVAEHVGGRTRLRRCASAGLLGARATPWGVLLVAQGAHVIGDDRIKIDVEVGPGARLEVGSIGATLSRRGPSGLAVPAITSVRVSLGEQASLSWRPEPGIAAPASLHRSESEIEMADGAELCWREEVVLGRFGEEATGSWWSALRCRYGGRPLLVSEVGLGPAATGWCSSSVLAGARAFSCLLVAGPRPEPTATSAYPGLDRSVGADLALASYGGPATASASALWRSESAAVAQADGARGAAMALAGPGREVVAAGPTLSACRRVIEVLTTGDPDDATLS